MHHDADDADMVVALGQFALVGWLIAGHDRAARCKTWTYAHGSGGRCCTRL